MLLRYFLNDFEMFPVVPVITGTIFVSYIPHMLCCCCCCCCCRRRRHHHHYHHLWRIIKGKGLAGEIEEEDVERRNKNRQNLTPVQV